SATENDGDGVVYSSDCYPQYAITGAPAEEGTVSAAASLYRPVYITNTTAIANGGAGISLTVAFNDFFVENVTTAGNDTGIVVNREELLLLGAGLGASVAIDSVVPIEPQVFIQDSLIQANESYR